MIEILDWFAAHWILTLFAGWCLFCGIESLIKAWRGKS